MVKLEYVMGQTLVASICCLAVKLVMLTQQVEQV